MDRCALFVDAGYMLADGATAVHGTSHRESVSWDYAGLLRFLTNVAEDRTGQQLLRCYWYEATVDGRRTPEHDTLADLPGLTLRLGRMRPGKREGVEPDIHRDLTTLARNRAISAVLLVSAEEDLAQVIADVQDLGVRVIIVHISVDGNWTVSRSLRQQCDDIVEVDGTQLQPHVELIVGAEPARFDEPYEVTAYGSKPLANGHGADSGGGGHLALSAGFTGSNPAGPAIYTAPVVAEYQRPAEPAVPQPSAPSSQELAPAAHAGLSEPSARGMHRSHAARDSPQAPGPSPAPQPSPPQFSPPQATPPQMPQPQIPPPQPGPPGPPLYAPPAPESVPEPAASAGSAVPVPPGPPAARPGQDLRAAQRGVPATPPAPAPPGPARPSPEPVQPAAGSPQVPSPPASGRRVAGPRPPYAPSHPDTFADPAAGHVAPALPEQFSSAPPSLPSRRGGQPNGMRGNGLHGDDLRGDDLRGDDLRGDDLHRDGLRGDDLHRNGPYGNGLHGDDLRGDDLRGDDLHRDGLRGDDLHRNGLYGDGPHGNGLHADGLHGNGPPAPPAPPRPQPGPRGHEASHPVAATPGYVPQDAAYDAQLPVPSTAGGSLASGSPAAGSLADIVRAAHCEGFEFGESVARDAPALWLEAVLARKPRMPSDLEARLLQVSALPIDSLLHDEVRHALRRGFWDALERSRR